MVDPKGEIELTAIGTVNIAVPQIDILSAWVIHGEDEIAMGWDVDDSSATLFPDEILRFSWSFYSTSAFREADLRVLHFGSSWDAQFAATTWDGARVFQKPEVHLTGVTRIEVIIEGIDLGLPAAHWGTSSIINSNFNPPVVGFYVWFRDWVDHVDSIIEVPRPYPEYEGNLPLLAAANGPVRNTGAFHHDDPRRAGWART